MQGGTSDVHKILASGAGCCAPLCVCVVRSEREWPGQASRDSELHKVSELGMTTQPASPAPAPHTRLTITNRGRELSRKEFLILSNYSSASEHLAPLFDVPIKIGILICTLYFFGFL